MNPGGRPRHYFWIEGQFEERQVEKGRIAAFCPFCKQILKNTAESRL